MPARFTTTILSCSAAMLLMMTLPAHALGDGLTPMGAEQAGNEDGTIPPWTGGLEQQPLENRQAGYQNPFADDEPRFFITADNQDEYRAHLTPGQMAMLHRHPETFRMPVYPTRRSASYPQGVYEAVARNARTAQLEGTDRLSGAATGPAFPVPENGAQAIWNHKTGYGTSGVRLYPTMIVVDRFGRHSLRRTRMDILPNYGRLDREPDELDNILSMYIQEVLPPYRAAGLMIMGHTAIDPEQGASNHWSSTARKGIVSSVPRDLFAYDRSDAMSNNQLTADQTGGFSGPLDKYEWELVGKREIFIPYNAYALEDKKLEPGDLVGPAHLNPAHLRYELHRVWVVDATLREGKKHRYSRRTFYLDEDSWNIALVDVYDDDGYIMQLQEAHLFNAYDVPLVTTTVSTIYPLEGSNRYLALNVDNNEPTVQFNLDLETSDMTPAALRRRATE